jgi:hypothetical protein
MRLNTNRRVLLGLLIGYCLFLAWVLLWPSATPASKTVRTAATDLRQVGAPAQVTAGDHVEFALNALMVAPVPLVASLLWRRWSWPQWTACGFIASCIVEAFQALFLSGRSAQMPDVVSNTLGALVGAVLGAGVRRSRRSRRPPPLDQ